MIIKSLESARYVTRLDNRWHGYDSVEFAVLHTEKMSRGQIGNKAYKLSAFLAAKDHADRIMSFGGAWSNHLHALAYLCHLKGIGAVGVIRSGECTDNVLLQSMRNYGMKLHFVDRAEYRRRDDVDYCESLSQSLECTAWLPEGGSERLAVTGCADIGSAVRECGFQPDVVIVPVGTGATLAGVVIGTDEPVRIIGLPVVRDDKVKANVLDWVGGQQERWELHAQLRPAYGKSNTALLRFIVDFYCGTGVILDPVYTGKALMHSLRPEFLDLFPNSTRFLLVHTGGLMGNYGYLREYQALPDVDSIRFVGALSNACSVHLTGQWAITSVRHEIGV